MPQLTKRVGTCGRRSVLRTAGFASGVLGLALGGCGLPGGAGTANENPTSSGPVQAKILTFNNALFQNAKDDFVAALAEVDPKLQPDIIVFPGQINQFREKVLAMYAGGDIPDAQWIHPSITSLMGSRKLLRPLDEFARKDKDTPLKEFYPGLMDYLRWQNTTYALPWYSTGYAWAFNRDLYQRMGVTPPDQLEKQGKWTWDEFVSNMRSMTRGTPGSPDRTIGSDNHSMALDWACAWIWRNGGDVFSKDMKKVVLNEPASIEAIQSLADLYLKHQAVNYGPHRTDFTDGFFSGRIGLRHMNKENTAPDRNDLVKATFSLGMVPVYKGKAGRVNRMAALGFGAAQGAPNGDAGWRWVRFMGGPKAAAILLRRGSTLPVRPSFQQLPEFAQSMQPWENKDYWLDSAATARALPQPASYNDIANLWMETWDAILAQKGPAKSLMDDMVRQANSVLAQEQ
ncbi:MAG TPA: extracellular solute-binding protein [Chloroflexota bacterium]|nr:extracellular solute-binding protein [Chloroflexota bacterium]